LILLLEVKMLFKIKIFISKGQNLKSGIIVSKIFLINLFSQRFVFQKENYWGNHGKEIQWAPYKKAKREAEMASSSGFSSLLDPSIFLLIGLGTSIPKEQHLVTWNLSEARSTLWPSCIFSPDKDPKTLCERWPLYT
jgi:hypothetical protein